MVGREIRLVCCNIRLDFPTFVVDENDPIRLAFSCIHDEYKKRPKK